MEGRMEGQKEERKDGRADEQTLFYKTLPAEARGPTKN